MRDKRTRGPGAQGPNDSQSKNDWLDEHLQPWAATPTPANDNAVGFNRKSGERKREAENDFADEATTLYHRERNSVPQQNTSASAKPARRPSARYRPQPLQSPQSKDEPRFGIEGSLPRSLRPGEVDRSRNYGVVLAGLLLIGLGVMWTMRGGAWSRAMLSLATYSSSVASTRATLGQGHFVEPARATPLRVRQLSDAPMQVETAKVTSVASVTSVTSQDVMEFELSDVPEGPGHSRADRVKRLRAQRTARHTNHTSKAAALAKPIQPLIEKTEEDYQEPVYYRAAVNEGTLQVNSRPWSRVLVDGHFMGHTPQRALRLPVGLHRVLLVNDQLDMSKLFEVNIPAGQVITRVEILDESAHTSR